MNENICRIICASAGTGKTYRLSLEYLALILQYYGKSEFSLDSILVLTFTRKATSEIRERIMSHLELLTASPDPAKQADLQNNLLQLIPDNRRTALSDAEKNLLLSAKQEITCDKTHLQVMTIDAYINHIFRNIVRPLRNIERYDIDTEAVEKRMPYLLDHLMKPVFRDRLKRLLTRKLSRSLDDYRAFFGSLVKQRWLYYLITSRILPGYPATEEKRLCDLISTQDPESSKSAFLDSLGVIIEELAQLCQRLQKSQYLDYFNKEFKELLPEGSLSPASVMRELKAMKPEKLEKLLGVLAKNFWNGNKLRSTSYPRETEIMLAALREARTKLADYLLVKLYLPEQQEIMELWGVILQEYDRLIYRDKNLTYDDISWFCFEALFSQEPPFMDPGSAASATEFYQFLSHRTRFLLIDEFQDTSLIQFNILKPIIEEISSGHGSKPFGGLIVVGDEKQSIFGWRGGERDLLLNLQDIFPAISEVQTQRLSECWRCGPTLMSFINSVFLHEGIHNFLKNKQMSWEYNLIRSAEIIKSEPGALAEFYLNSYSSSDPENRGAKEMIWDFVQRMVRPALEEDGSGSIAILCRKGKELAEIQLALDEAGITSLYQPDRSIIEHRFVSPLLAWLRFVAWGDWIDFIQFLRSDYLRIKTAPLKRVLKAIAKSKSQSREHYLAPDFEELTWVELLYRQALEHRLLPASQICRSMAEAYLNPELAGERDYLNLHHWLDLVAGWELNSNEVSLPDLLTWVKNSVKSEDFKQVSVSGEGSLQLLTFHKAKGLQFQRVFVYYNLSGGNKDDSRYLQWAVRYAGKDFQYLLDYGISYHYQKILKASAYAQLWEEQENRAMLEEMNNLYVAFTRAEKKLHLYFCYNGKISWPEYMEKHADAKLPVLVCEAIRKRFIDCQPDERGVSKLESSFQVASDQDKTDKKDETPLPEQNLTPPQIDYPRIVHHRTLDLAQLLPVENQAGINSKQLWLVTKPNLKGDLLHLYLSFILRNTSAEHAHAYKRCILRYGAIFTRTQIDELVQRALQVCSKHAWLFDPAWDKVFSEQEIYHNGNRLRVDRLMVNQAAKKALIIDYKSGEIHDAEQMATYHKAVSALPALQGFRVDTEIISI